MKKKAETKITVKDICFIGMMVAVIEVCKAAISFLPNIELTTFWLIMFTLFFGRKIVLVIPVFILLEAFVYGFSDWVIMYLYVWPLLVLLTWIFRKQHSMWFWSIFSALYGLFFGLLCALTYVGFGMVDGGVLGGLQFGFAKWVSGIPFDITHCIGNFVIMMILYKPIRRLMEKLKKVY